MAAAPPPRDRDDSLNIDGGGHGYGKFRKQPFRRATKTTPYDRPPSAVRNPASGSLHGQGWLSKLVLPAQSLITSSAFQLLGSVFPKRLPPPPPPQPPEQPELIQRNVEKQPLDLGSAGQLGKPAEDVIGRDNPSNNSSTGGVSELELILKQKTFTRSEIDHLTAILLSRVPGGDEEKKPEFIHSRVAIPQDQKEFPNTSLGDNRVGGNLDSAPMPYSRVLDEDVASPIELAKAYMGRRPSMGSPLKQGFSNQPLMDNSTALMNHPFTARSPMASSMPSASRRAVFPENGFVTPRPQGRTAIYSMARTPYSKVLYASGLQNSGARVDTLGELPSSSQNSWENNRFSGSKQGALKRRSSVLDSDIGSVGPIRRIRQKSNLLPSSKTFSVRRDGFVSDAGPRPSSVEKSFLVGEPSKGNGGNNINESGINPVPSKSREVASKILQQLDVLVSSREKSPTKLSPSMLSGPALRSLENADSSKFLENLDVKHGNLLPDPRDIQPQELDKIEENGPKKHIALFDKSDASIDGVDSTNLVKNDMPGVKATVGPVTDTVLQSSLHNNRRFQMSAHEDFLELDGDDNCQEILHATNSGTSEKLETVLVENRTTSIDAVRLEKPPALPESIITETSDGLIIPATCPSTIADQQAMADSRSKMLPVKATVPEKSDASASAEKVIPAESQDYASVTLNSGSSTPLLKFSPSVAENDLASVKAQGWSDSNPGDSSSAPVSSGTNDSAGKEFELEKDDNKNTMKVRVLARQPEPALSAVATSSSAANIFSFGIATSSNQNSGSIASTSSSFSIPPLVSHNVHQNPSVTSSGTLAASISDDVIAITFSASNANSGGSLSTSMPAPFFKFGSSVVLPTSVSSGLATGMTGSTEAETKRASFDVGASSAITSMVVTNSMFTSTEGNLFGGTSAITSTGSSTLTGTSGNNFGGSSAFANTGVNSFSDAPSGVTSSGSSTIDGMPSAVASMGSSGSVAIMSSGISNVNGASSAVTSAPSSIFGFNSGVTATTTANQCKGFNPFGASSVLTSSAASSQKMPLQLSSSAPSPSQTSAGNATFSVGNSVPSSSTSATLFGSNATFGLISSSSSASDSISSTNSATPLFGSSWQGPKSPPLSTPTPSSSSSSLSTAFSFGPSTSASSASTSTSGLFGGSSFNPSSSASPFSFSSPATSMQAQPVFGNINPSFALGSSRSNNSDRITMEDSMAEDPVQASSPPVPVFGQQPASSGFTFGLSAPPAGNQFGSTAPSAANPFQFLGQPTPVAPQNQSPFQASGSFSGAGSSFSLGAGGGDKSQRRIFKAKRHQRKK